MKRQTLSMLVIMGVGSLAWGAAQGNRSDLFDLKKSRQELEVMKGILSTTIGFVANEMQGRGETQLGRRESYLRIGRPGSDIGAYYLYGQGATFIIPISSFHYGSALGGKFSTWQVMPKIARAGSEDWNDSLFRFQAELEAMNREVAANNEDMAAAARDAALAAEELAREVADQKVAIAGGVPGGVVGGIAGGVPGGVAGGVAGGVGAGRGGGVGTGTGRGTGTPQAAPAPPPAPQPPQAGQYVPQQQKGEQLRKRLEDAQARVRKTREDIEARNKKLLESLTQIGGYLVEALANHGDSLTHVRPNEYINIIITTDEGTSLLGDISESLSRRDVISVQKSVITDYKAGRMSLDAFKQKVLLYND